MEKNLKDDSAKYLKSWLSNLKQDPSYIKTTLFDVKRSANYISTRVESIDNRLKRDGVNADFSDIREQNKKDSALFIANENKIEDKPKQEEKEEENINTSEKIEEDAQKSEHQRFRR